MAVTNAPITFSQFVKYPIYAVAFTLIIYFCQTEFFEKENIRAEAKKECRVERDAQDRIINQKDKQIAYERNRGDSLQSVIINRSDKSYEELKRILKVDNNRSTVIIKPKKR